MTGGMIDYIVINTWMVTELGLSGNDLLIFAIVYGFSRDKKSAFYGSFNTIANTIGTSRRTVIRVVEGLEKRGLIKKIIVNKDGVSMNGYHVFNKEKPEKQGGDILSEGGDILSLGGDILSNATLYKNKYIKDSAKQFKKPTIKEVEEYCKSRGNNIDANYFIDYYESNGWIVGRTKMKDWKAAVRNWERRQQPKQEIDYHEGLNLV